MPSSQFLPWLKNQKVYACQRCLNHNLTVARKDHKKHCPFLNCNCPDCLLVDKRRVLNAELARVKSMEIQENSKENVSSGSESSETSNVSLNPVPVERLPHCQRCAQHNVQNRLKGHKRFCAFRDCSCAKCRVVTERQRLMADQIKLRRRQKKQKAVLQQSISTPESPSSSNPEIPNFEKNPENSVAIFPNPMFSQIFPPFPMQNLQFLMTVYNLQQQILRNQLGQTSPTNFFVKSESPTSPLFWPEQK
uniref:DM domain-containing protein n=1 Tax=Panagrolaimus sp. JU765 TaxID=591449 RepID=A0AC34QNR3_9BILA